MKETRVIDLYSIRKIHQFQIKQCVRLFWWFCRPPAISGSHTLAHAGRKHHEMMVHQHVHPHHGQMRSMGTHTLGRLPSHNHSPGHNMPGPNNGKYATLSKQCKTLEANDFYWNSAACGDPHGNSSHAHHHHHHYSDGHQVQIQHHPPHQPLAVGSVATMRRPVAREDAIPSSSVVDSALFERDKQIYRCSTMRQGGRFDQKAGGPMKPAILNCPLPEIPKKTDEQVGHNNFTSDWRVFSIDVKKNK